MVLRYEDRAVRGVLMLGCATAGLASLSLVGSKGTSHPVVFGGVVAVACVLLTAIEPTFRRYRSAFSKGCWRIVLGCLAGIGRWFGDGRYRSEPADQLDGSHRTLVLGDDRGLIDDVIRSLPAHPHGVLTPTIESDPGFVDRSPDADGPDDLPVADGGATVDARTSDAAVGTGDRLDDPARLREVLRDRDVDTVVLALQQSDRQAFFGALRACRGFGIDVLAHEQHRTHLLTANDPDGDLVAVELDPWGPLDRLVKRTFDVVVAGLALLVLLPITLLIVLAIAIEGHGPVFFSQTRTCLFGRTFTIRKFRTLKPKKGGEVGTEIDEDRHTPLGQFLRTTHFDEIPQLWSILVGDMSVVGPRPAQTELEPEFEAEAPRWRRRWFVRPGLTGLAQICGATSSEPKMKLKYDLRYIRNQSLLFDLRILGTQLYTVIADVLDLLRRDR